MGIQGLTSYVNRSSDRYLENYELHDTFLVIDGNSVSCQIYTTRARVHSSFGGDYDAYAESVSQFFDDLLKCNVTPLVLLDGGVENKKLRTVANRSKDKIRTSVTYCPTQNDKNFFPLARLVVFKDIVREKGIRLVNCLFEADNTIALVAKLLDCPVLSYDSDFYIYGSLYIPFNTLHDRISRCSTGKGHYLCCQIYRIENLLGSFKGLTESMLPLAAILLGNDYVHHGTFKKFFYHIKLCSTGYARASNQQQRIKTVLTWLSRYSLNPAIVRILSRVPKRHRKKILNIIEKNINSYICTPTDVILQLGLSEEHIKSKADLARKPFQFNGDINNLTCVDEDIQEEDSEDTDEGDEVENDIGNILEKCTGHSDDKYIDALPPWFIHEFQRGNFDAECIDLIIRSFLFSCVQIEDYSSPSAVLASQTIIGVIHGLLVSGLHGKKDYVNIMIRDCDKLVSHRVEVDSSVSLEFPPLADLREVPLLARKQIIDNTLGVKDACISQLPVEWMLYVTCMKYWIDHTQVDLIHSQCYIYSLLVCMIFHIIDKKIGRHRSMRSFEQKYKRTVESIEKARRESNYKTEVYSADALSSQPWDDVSADDCLLAVSFFLPKFQLDQKLCVNIKKFNKAVVHAFAEFQNCVYYASTLNALLGYPYAQPHIHRLYNGTFLYNLYSKLKTTNDPEVYITTSLTNSPSVLALFKGLLAKVKPLFPSVQWGERRKRRSKRSKVNE